MAALSCNVLILRVGTQHPVRANAHRRSPRLSHPVPPAPLKLACHGSWASCGCCGHRGCVRSDVCPSAPPPPPAPRRGEFITRQPEDGCLQWRQQQLPSPMEHRACQGALSLHSLFIPCLVQVTAPGEGWLVFEQAAGATVSAWEVGSLSASLCLQVSSQHLPVAPFRRRLEHAAGASPSLPAWGWHSGCPW